MSPVEHLDILDANGNATGFARDRDLVHRNGDLHRTVHIWIVNSRKQVLLQKRAADKETNPGLWDLSCAGHIVHGETSLEAAVKEIAEELGIQIPPADLVYVFSARSVQSHQNGQIIDNEIRDVYLVQKDIPLRDFRIQTEEVAEIAYMSLSDFCRKVRNRDADLVPHFDEFETMCRHLLPSCP